MKVVFISNALTPHQIEFCDEIYSRLKNNFVFISTDTLSKERIEMGWNIYKREYELKQYESEAIKKLCSKIILEADVVLLGSSSDTNIIERLKRGKLTFRYSERLYKEGLSIKRFPRAAISAYIHHGRFKKYPLYMLCASAYTAADLNIFRNYKDKMYKWGYFPEFKRYNICELLNLKSNNCTQILWVGRLIDLKQPSHAIEVVNMLNKDGYEFKFRIVGSGESERKLKNLVEKYNLSDKVEFIGNKSVNEVRSIMEKSNIYLFTSSFEEGWGVVLNEAMNSGCNVIASHSIGAAPYLINDGENGFIYKNGDLQEFYKKLKSIIEDKENQKRIAKNAYMTIAKEWNYKVAVDRFLKLSSGILKNEKLDFPTGPCSKAEIIKNNWR